MPDDQNFITRISLDENNATFMITEPKTETKHASEKEPPRPNYPTRTKLLALRQLTLITLGAYLGVLVRVTLTTISEKTGPISYLGAGWFLPNIVGCFVMGCVVNLQELFIDYPAIYLAIGTGFCGSCTTFSTWQGTVVKGYANGLWLQGILQSAATFATSQAAFEAGGHISALFKWLKSLAFRSKSTPDFCQVLASRPALLTSVAVGLFLASTLAIWAGAFLDPSQERRFWWISVAFGPLGALIRYGLSLWNPKFPTFPLWTFVANISASVANVGISILEAYLATRPQNPSDIYVFNFWISSGLSVGTFGCLSTVSTWINELNKLTAKNILSGYRYGLVTIFATEIVCLSMIGIWFLAGNSFGEFI